MNVKIPEDLFFDMVDLLVAPKALLPAQGNCVLTIENRNRVLDRLLVIRRAVVQTIGHPPSADYQFK
ncbi:MAG: hypothetical protein LJE63_01305 [Desulfobacteraceae bacterium]|jgi:hypothetical protein|nr:hypothetical protein [Desulfobacteraceae bacterium]